MRLIISTKREKANYHDGSSIFALEHFPVKKNDFGNII
jgi:hypothetical protein